MLIVLNFANYYQHNILTQVSSLYQFLVYDLPVFKKSTINQHRQVKIDFASIVNKGTDNLQKNGLKW